MHEPNFFQSKLALAKAFPGRKLPMTKLHQLYRDIYCNKPKQKALSAAKDDPKIGVFHGEVSIYNHKDMDKLIDKYLDFDGGDMQYYAEALINTESPTVTPKKKNVTIKSRIKDSTSVPPARLDEGFTLTKFNLQKPSARENIPSNNPSYRTQMSTISYFDKSPPLDTNSQKKIQAKKWPKEIQALHESIEKHSTVNKSQRKILSTSVEETQAKENLNDINSQIKIYFHRLGLDHHKTAMEEVKEINKYSKRTDSRETASIRGTPTMMAKDEIRNNSSGFVQIQPERTLSIFSKPNHRSETTSTDYAGERHLSVFSKARRTQRVSDIPSLEIPSVNYHDRSGKVEKDKSAFLPENTHMQMSQSQIQVVQQHPSRLLHHSQSVAGTPVNHRPSPLLPQVQSPGAITTGNFFLPKVNRRQKETSINLSRPVRDYYL